MTTAIYVPVRIAAGDFLDVPIPTPADDGKGLAWNQVAQKHEYTAFEVAGVAAGLMQAHVAAEDPHTGYLLASGARPGATGQAQAFTSGIIAPSVRPASDSATALQWQRATGVPVVTLDTISDYLLMHHPSDANLKMRLSHEGIRFSRGTTGSFTSGLFSDLAALPNLTLQAQSSLFFVVASGSRTYSFGSDGIITAPAGFSSHVATASYSTPSNSGMEMYFDPAANTDQGLKIRRGTRAASAHNYIMAWFRGTSEFARIAWDGRFGVGVADPSAFMDLAASTTARASLRMRAGVAPTSPNDGDWWNDGNAFAMRVNGTNAVNTDGGFAVWMQSSTSARPVGRLLWQYTDKTDATRTTQGALTAWYTSTEHKIVNWGANSGGALLSFYPGVTPVARQLLATGVGASTDDVITFLQNLGLARQS